MIHINNCELGHPRDEPGPLCPYCELAAAKARIADQSKLIDAMAAETLAALKERDALRADAERYRWLRDYPRRQDLPDDKPWWNVSAAYSHECYVYRGADLDAAIDAAMAASAPAPDSADLHRQ